MNGEELRSWIREECQRVGSQKAAAAAWGVSPQHLSDIVRGKREPGEEALRRMGWRRVVGYERIEVNGD